MFEAGTQQLVGLGLIRFEPEGFIEGRHSRIDSAGLKKGFAQCHLVARVEGTQFYGRFLVNKGL